MRSYSFIAIAAVASVVIAAGSASASLIVKGSAGGGWQSFPTALNDYTNAQRPYWDQDTMDRAGTITNRNIGNYLNNTWTGSLPGGSAVSPNITPNWWGNASIPDFNASMDNGIGFDLALPSNSIGAQLRLEVAGLSNTNELGWYLLSDTAGTETLNTIFSGPTSPVSVANFAPSASFGFYLKSGGGNVFFTESNRNRTASGTPLGTGDRNTQHFALFASSLISGSEEYYIGVEDLTLSSTGREAVGDYNDLVFRINAVPTPGSLALLGLGGIVAGRRKR